MGTTANIQLKPCSVTWGTTDLGFTDGDLEITLEETLVDITSHQTGADVLGHFRTGKTVEMSLTLKETTVAKLKDIFAAGGGSVTPASGTEVIGWGASKQFLSTIADAKKLVLHPLTKSGSDHSEDITFWLAYPMIESMTLSAESPATVSVSFKVYRDDTKDAKINMIAIGDGTQDLDA